MFGSRFFYLSLYNFTNFSTSAIYIVTQMLRLIPSAQIAANHLLALVFLYLVISLNEGSQTMACQPPTNKKTLLFSSTSFFVKVIICWSLKELAS
jgi:hypothetical protein